MRLFLITAVSRSLSGTERPHGADQNMDDTNDQFPMHLKSSQTSSKGDSEDIHFGRSPSERLPVSEKSRRRPPASTSCFSNLTVSDGFDY